MWKSDGSWRRGVWFVVVLFVVGMLVVPRICRAGGDENPTTKGKDAEKKTELEKKSAVRPISPRLLRATLQPSAALEKAREAAAARQKKEEDERNTDPAWKPSHEQTSVIKLNEGRSPSIVLNNFCLNGDGNLLAACSGNQIRVIAPDGKLLKTWGLDFTPQAIGVADDLIFVAGNGHMAKLDQTGKTLLAASSPQMSALPPLPEAPPKESDAAKLAREKKVAELRVKADEARKAYLKAYKAIQPPKDATDEQKSEFRKKFQDPSGEFRRLLDEFQAAQNALREASLTPEMLVAQKRAELQSKSNITGIAITKEDVFVACPMAKTYGYSVWRVDRNFKNAKLIVEGLAGCCGQMDIQARDGELWIAHNARHKVERYDRNGKKLADFGKTDRKAADGFGGCCEPKNLRFGSNGDLYASESGPPVAIKRFSPEGKFLGVVGVPTYQTGCVRVTVEVSRDGRQVFILNPGENAIHVFSEKKADSKAASEKSASPKT